MRVVLFALTGFGNTALEALQGAGCDVAAVVTEKEPGPFPHYPEENLADIARRKSISVYENMDLKGSQGYEVVKGLAPDLALIATFRQIMPARLVSVPKYGTINVHSSLLPKYRGATPTNWVLVFGESETGVTLHWAISRPDAGDIISQRRVPIALDETDGTLRRKLAALAKGMIVEVIEQFKSGQMPVGYPQDTSKATLFPKRAQRDALIKFDEPTLNVHNRIRGMTPYPGAYTLHRGSEVRIITSEPVSGESFELTPGLITRRVDGFLVVKTKDGLIKIKTDPEVMEEEMQRAPIVFGGC